MSEGFVAEIDANAKEAAEEAASGGNGFPPLAAGKYQAHVIKVVGVEQFAKSGPNAGKKCVKIQLQIVDESPTGRKRVFFDRIPLFTRFAPNEKNPKGASARAFWDFWGKAIGWEQDQLILGNLPGVRDVQGKQVTITLSAPKPPDTYNPLGSNDVSFYDKAGDVNASPTFPPVVPWLDANGNLIGGAAPVAPGVQAQAAAQSTPPAWGTPPAWQPAAADVATAQQLAAASAGGKGF